MCWTCRVDGARRARRARALRSLAAGVSGFTALVAWGLVAGPTARAEAGGLCALPRTRAHHSEGTDGWNAFYPRPRRTLDAVMVFLSFPDSAPEPARRPAGSRAGRPAADRAPRSAPRAPGGRLATREVAADHFPATARFLERASYGAFRLRVHRLGGWLRMPAASTAYRIRRDWEPGHRAAYLRDAVAVADREVDFSSYDLVYLVADPGAPGVNPDATKVVNLGRPLRADGAALAHLVTVFERHPPDRNVLAHETGHLFDLPDLYHRPAPGSPADWDTYVGDWDLMGNQFGLAPDLFAWHRWRLGWLRLDQVRCVVRPGTGRYHLSPVEVPDGRVKLLVVRTGPDEALAIEARRRYGNDVAACTEGVLMYRVRSGVRSGDGPVAVIDAHPRTSACRLTSVHPPLADAPLTLGESYVHTPARTRVTVTAPTPEGGWTVAITRA